MRDINQIVGCRIRLLEIPARARGFRPTCSVYTCFTWNSRADSLERSLETSETSTSRARSRVTRFRPTSGNELYRRAVDSPSIDRLILRQSFSRLIFFPPSPPRHPRAARHPRDSSHSRADNSRIARAVTALFIIWRSRRAGHARCGARAYNQVLGAINKTKGRREGGATRGVIRLTGEKRRFLCIAGRSGAHTSKAIAFAAPRRARVAMPYTARATPKVNIIRIPCAWRY